MVDEELRNALKDAFRYFPIVILLIAIIWAGKKGFFYWRPGVNIVIRQVERERDDWRKIAIELLKEKGIDLPPNLNDPKSITELINNKK